MSARLRPLRAVRRKLALSRHVPAWWRAWRNQVLTARNRPPLVNVAIRGQASQSSTQGGDGEHGAMIGISGRMNDERFFSTERQSDPWWMVDLGVPWPIYAIRLHNRAGTHAWLAARLSVSISADGAVWKTVLSGVHFFGDPDAPGPLEIRLCSRDLARFVRLELPGLGVLSLRQVEVLVETRFADRYPTCERYGLDYLAMIGSKPAHFYAVEHAPQPFDGTIDAFHIARPIGRFGNHFKTLVLAICLARRLGVRRIYLARLSQIEIAEPLAADGITLLPERMLATDRPGAVLSGSFFHESTFGEQLNGIEAEENIRAVRNLVRPLFWRTGRTPPFMPQDTDLAIHIRSGDLFSKKTPHKEYVQPPLAYYQRIVRHAQRTLGIRRVILVYEDEVNPCVGALRRWLQQMEIPVIAQSASLKADLSVLLHARHCVFGYGSFGPAIIRLSNVMRTAFLFWTQPGATAAARAAGVRPILARDLAGRYIAPGTWNASPEQRQAMLDYPIDSIALDEDPPAMRLSLNNAGGPA